MAQEKRDIPPEMTLDESQKHPIEPEDQSLFGTQRPRPMGVGRHLLVVLLCFLAALGLAIYYAESPIETKGGTQSPTAPPP